MTKRLRPSFYSLAVTVALFVASAAADPTVVFELPYKGPRQIDSIVQRGLEVLALTKDRHLHVAGTAADRAFLSRHGIKPTILPQRFDDTIAALDSNLGDYRTYAEMEAVINALQSSHPTLFSFSSIGTSIEGRSIYALKISDNVASDENEPEALIIGCHHARELMSVEIPLQFAEYLLTQYGSDPDVTQMVNEREIWIVPIVNPDGYVYVQHNHGGTSGSWWRKNRRDNGGGVFGVDLNRNYDYQWGFDDIGSSPDPSRNTYRGTAGFSEPETAAIRDLCNSRSFTMAFSYHSYGELLLFPWGYEYSYTTDHEIFQNLGDTLASSNGYLVGNTAQGAIYRTNGDFDDWAYGENVTKPAIFGFTPEVGSAAEGGFAPPESLIGPYFDLLLPMNMQFLDFAGDPNQVLGPFAPSVISNSARLDGDIVLHWSDNVPQDTNPALTYELESIQNPGFLPADDAESVSPYLDLAGGFVASSARAQEGSNSYYSGQANNLSATVAAVVPFSVSPQTDAFTCWMWYDIEPDYDYAYVEISEDEGVIWQTIEGDVTTSANPNGANRGHGITGNSGGWVFATFQLDAFMGQDVLLRIRYVTDGFVLEEGLYVDFLGPVPSFDARTIVATGLTGTSHQFFPGGAATYAYRVRGQDADADWSRWSASFVVEVDNTTSTRVVPPRVSGLGPNQPNPFNPVTLIPYTVGARAGDRADAARSVQLSIYDALGRRVVTLVDDDLVPGSYRAAWNGISAGGAVMPSGSYFARLSVDASRIATRTLVLLK